MDSKVISELQRDWKARLFIFGICLFLISFFLPVSEHFSGYEAAVMPFESLAGFFNGQRKFDLVGLLLNLFFSCPNFFVLLVGILYFNSPQRKSLLLIPLFGIPASMIWIFLFEAGNLKSGYWIWLTSLIVVMCIFTIKLFTKAGPANVR